MPVSKRTGKRYAAGSHKELGSFPRECFGCGEKVRITKDYCWQETLEPSGEKRMWHMTCRLAAVKIAPYMKGPADAPLLEHAYKVAR